MKKLLAKIIPLAYGVYFNVLSLFSRKKAAKKAFQTFCTIRKGRVTPEQADFLENAKNGQEFVNNRKLQTYQWRGNGDTVLLLHGWESNSYRWRNLISYLKKADFNILAFDAPAHGHSSGKWLHVPLYTECVQHIVEKYDPKHMVAHSVGGMTALYNQFKYPESPIEKIVTIGSPSEFHEIMSEYQRILGFSNRVMKSMDDYILENFGFQIRDFSTSRFAASNTKKGLLFHDRLDAIAPFHASERVHANWKGSELIATEGLGHSMHQDEVNQKIVDFLNS